MYIKTTDPHIVREKWLLNCDIKEAGNWSAKNEEEIFQVQQVVWSGKMAKPCNPSTQRNEKGMSHSLKLAYLKNKLNQQNWSNSQFCEILLGFHSAQ